MTASPAMPRARRVASELALLVGFGLVMVAVGPYGTGQARGAAPLIYWLLAIVGGGAIGIGVDETLGRRAAALWRRIALTTLVMTPLVAVLVWFIGLALIPFRFRPQADPSFLGQVFLICLLLMTFRALTWRAPQKVIETRTVIAPPLPEAEAAFRRRLSARRRHARLIAVQAEDHYLRVHTDAGDELISLRFADALTDLAAAHGHRTHRSWWVSAQAIEAVTWRKSGGEARLAGGLAAPVSRTYAAGLREAGWF